MFIKNPFKTNICILLFYILFRQSQSCIGTDIGKLDDNCDRIDTKPLVFRGTEDVNTIRQKVKSIVEINSGIEIIGTDYESFDFFNGTLKKLRNGNGPAITLRENSKLKRLHFDGLEEIDGKDGVILLDKTYFSTAASQGPESLYDIVKLESVHRNSTGGEICSDNFVSVTRDEVPEESNILVFVFGAGCVVFVIGAGVLLYFNFKRRAALKKLEAKRKGDSEAKEGKNGNKNSGDVEDGGTAKKAPSLQEKVDEDPKKK